VERPPTPQEEAEYDAFVERQENPDAERSKFSQLESKLAAKKTKGGKQKIKNPGGLAYAIGKAKYGKAGMAKKAAAGKAKANK